LRVSVIIAGILLESLDKINASHQLGLAIVFINKHSFVPWPRTIIPKA